MSKKKEVGFDVDVGCRTDQGQVGVRILLDETFGFNNKTVYCIEDSNVRFTGKFSSPYEPTGP